MKSLRQIIGLFLVNSILFFLGSKPALSSDDLLFVQRSIKREREDLVQIFDPEVSLHRTKKRRMKAPIKKNLLQDSYHNQTDFKIQEEREIHPQSSINILRINRPNVPAGPPQDTYKKVNDEEIYHIPLSYYCEPDEVSYSGIDYVGIIATNDKGYFQEFVSENWDKGRELSFKKYKSQEPGFLTITKAMLPLELSVRLIASRQPLKILRSIYRNEFPKPLLREWRVWREAEAIFTIEEHTLLDSNGKMSKFGMLIESSEPESIDFIHFVR